MWWRPTKTPDGVAIYVRVSTEEQRERQSILTQREFAERYCELHKLAVYRIYADDGVSGTLGRETRLILNAVAELEKLGVRIRSTTEGFDTRTATGQLMLTMLSGFASYEREVIRERSVAGTNRVAESGV
jgi:site-specific DNA recombinase